MSHRLAICNELFEGWTLAETSARCREWGYEGLELAPFTLAEQPLELSPAARAEISRTITSSGLEVVGLHWLLARTKGLHLTTADRKTRQRTLEYLEGLADMCADLGGRILVFGSPQQRSLESGTTHADGEARAAELFSQLAPVLAERGVVLGLEPLGPEETNFLQTAESAVRLIEAVGSSQIRLHLDVKAMSTEQLGYGELIRRYAPWLVHFHANDPNRLGPGMGTVDYRAFWDDLADCYQGWLSVEVFDYAPGPEVIARQSLNYLRQMEQKSG
ncbi:MAG: sugar phosphate isomerase/epimerase [Blastopirellula sp.]|nr:sugar phosphate isomerase/epimerase [Blastopirellula sp.]